MGVSRHKAREQTFCLLFEQLFHADDLPATIIERAREYELIDEDDFTLALYTTATDKTDKIDEIIDLHLKGWSRKRISRVSLAVLRLAVCEILYFDDIPVGASINEAVELAKTYGAEDDAPFVNGVLGAVARAGQTDKEEA